MKNDRKSAVPAVGISALLTIFGVLCMTVFAFLSVSTVRAHQRLGESSRQAVIGYYEAEEQAHEILANLRAGSIPQGVQRQENVYSYSCSISENQSLQVQVQVEGTAYTVLCWQVVSTTDWEAEEDLPVWDGTFPQEE